MFAHYVVALVNGVPTPFITYPGDPKGRNRHLDALKNFDIEQDVVSAGVLTWTGGKNGQVSCDGSGEIVVGVLPSKVITLQSRGPQDAELCREFLSKPIRYMVLSFRGNYHPVLVPKGETPDWVLLSRFQMYPYQVVRGAGWVDFGLSSGYDPRCYGDIVLNDKGNRLVPYESQELTDMAILERTFVKGDRRVCGGTGLAFV